MTRPTLKPKLGANRVTLDLGGIQDGAHPLSFATRGAELDLGGAEKRVFRDFVFAGTLIRAGGSIEIRAALMGALETSCDRCLGRFTREIATELHVRALSGESPAGGETPENAIRLPPGASHLDLTEHLREAALLEIPIKNLCREDCRGLCPQCGANRNIEECECDPPAGDSRWDALRELVSSPEVKREEE